MVLIPMDGNDKFTGLLVSVTPNRSRGIYDQNLLSTNIQNTVKDFCEARGILTSAGFLPGIGSATGPGPSQIFEWILRTIPLLGKAIIASLKLGKVIRRRVTAYQKKKLRPFVPTVGIHLDIWPKRGMRSRKETTDLSDTLFLLPELSAVIRAKHHNILASYLVTANSERGQLPPVRVDADACSEATMVKLAAAIDKNVSLPDPPTHYLVTKRWGIFPKISVFRDRSGAFSTVFRFPNSPT